VLVGETPWKFESSRPHQRFPMFQLCVTAPTPAFARAISSWRGIGSQQQWEIGTGVVRDKETRIFFALRLLLAMVFVAAGIAKLAAIEFEAQAFSHFGYGRWFMYVIGALEIIGSILILLPRCAAFGAGLMLPVMVGAAYSHLNAGDAMVAAMPAMILFALLAIIVMRGLPEIRALAAGSRALAIR